jgi:FkbM family methyltransferase
VLLPDVERFHDVRKLSKLLKMLRFYRRPVVALWNRLNLPTRSDVRTYEFRNGPRITVTSGRHDVRVLNEIWLDRIYELRRGFAPRQGWTVIDLGAHKGAFSVRAMNIMGNGNLYACEPEPINFEMLDKNLKAMKSLSSTEVHLRQIAVGAWDRWSELYIDHEESGRNSLYVPASRGVMNEEANRIQVEVVSLEKLLAQIPDEIDLIKMDVEGSEYEIVLDSHRHVWQRVKRIVLEYDGRAPSPRDASVAELEDHLRDCSYSVLRDSERHLLFAERI